MSESYSGYARAATLGAAAFSFESWAFGPDSWMYAYGGGLETVPTHLALGFGDRLFSPWAPFVAGGLDRYAFWGNADPISWESLLIATLPTWLAVGLHRYLQYWIAIYFAARVADDQLRLGTRASLAAGLLYASLSYFTFGEMLALPALPLFLVLLGRALRWPIAPASALLVGLLFSTCTTFTHSVPYFACTAGLWMVAVLRERSLRAIGVLGGLVLGLALGDAPQALAAIAQAPLAHRAAYPPEPLSLGLDGVFYRALRFDYFNQDPFAKVLTWTLPLPALSAAALGLAVRLRGGVASSEERTFLRLYGVYFLLSQRWLFIGLQHAVGAVLPWVHSIYMGRFFDVPASLLIALQIAALVAVARLRLARHPQILRIGGVAVACLIAVLLVRPKVFLFYRIGADGYGEASYAVPALEAIARAEREPFRVASVLPLQPAYAYGQGLETADGWANLYPRYYREYWLRVIAPLLRELPAAKAIFDPDTGRPQDHYIFLGADLVHPTTGRLPGEDVAAASRDGFDVSDRFDLALLGRLNVKYLLSELPLRGDSISLVHAPDRATVSGISRDWATGLRSPPLASSGHGVIEKLHGAWRDWRAGVIRRRAGKDVFVYRLSDFVPRFRFVAELRAYANDRAALDALCQLTSDERSEVAVIGADRPEAFRSGRYAADASVVVADLRASELHLDVSAPTEALLVASVTWSSYWRAEVDGAPMPIARVDHTQIGVRVPAGARRVTLRYLPPYWPR